MAAADDRPDRTRGFWAWVKRPWIRRRFEDETADKEAELAAFDPARVSDREITRLVDGLLDRRKMFPVTQKFERLGRRAVPQLLRALSDPRFLNPYRGRDVSGVPLKDVLDLLEPHAPPEIVGRLAELMGHPDRQVRKAAGKGLGRLATPTAVEPWLAASRDPDNDVRSEAVWGIDSALRAGRVAPEFGAGVVGRVVELLEDPSPGFHLVKGAAGVLAQLDPCRALVEFLDPRRFTPANPGLHDLLEAADEHKLPFPPDRVVALLAELRSAADDYFGGSMIGHLLRQLARQRSADAGRWAAEAGAWATPGSNGAKHIGQAVAHVSALFVGVENPTHAVLTRLEAAGNLDRLTAPQRAYFVAWVLDAEVRNGGFAQYFVNSSGGTAGDAVAAFEAIGAAGHAAVVRRAAALFGPAGPAADRDERHEQLAGLSGEQDAEMARLDTEYYEVADDVAARLLTYASRHPEHFRTGGGG